MSHDVPSTEEEHSAGLHKFSFKEYCPSCVRDKYERDRAEEFVQLLRSINQNLQKLIEGSWGK